jgi:hypothetical protein
MPIDYETAEITLKMDAVQFEAVHTTLQEFCEGAPDTVFQDRKDTIKTLEFVFSNKSEPTAGGL